MAYLKGDNICACAKLGTHIARKDSDVKFFRWSKSNDTISNNTYDSHCVVFKYHVQGPGMKDNDVGRTFRLHTTSTKTNDKKM